LVDALRGASKSQSGKGPGKPEFVFESGQFLVIVEDKRQLDRTIKTADDKVDTGWPARMHYAVNGAVHYAERILENSSHYQRIFAVGITGDTTHNQVVAVYVDREGSQVLGELDSLDVFAPGEIEEFYRVRVLGELPREERELREVRKVAEDLHEAMRNYGSLEGERKATAVSAILLALRTDGFQIDDLRGSKASGQTDGHKIFNAAKSFLEEADLDR